MRGCRLLLAVVLGYAVHSAPAQAQGTPDPAVAPGAEWLLTQQLASGAYPWTVGGPVENDSQGTTARGMLAAHAATQDPAFLASAVRSGDFLIGSYPRSFPNGSPAFFGLDPLFLEELTLVTGAEAYADFVQSQLWDKLTAGTYGENQDQNAAAWAEAMPEFEEYPWKALRPYFRASAAVAAHYAGEFAIRDALLANLLLKLEQTVNSNKSGDLTGLAAAIWASSHTGFDLDPKAGRYKSKNSTQALVDLLVSYQRTAGDWPYDSSTAAANHVGDVSVTSEAVMALKAWDAERYADNIARALSFVRAQQQPDGQILTNPGWPADTETGVIVHAQALEALATNDGTLFEPVVINLPPTAVNDVGSTTVDTAVAIAVLANDSDGDGQLAPASVTVVRQPARGIAVADAAGVVTYTPDAGYLGSDSFDYTVDDDAGATSNVASVAITVTSVPPVTTFFDPIADTYVAQAQPAANYGSATSLDIRQKSLASAVAYLKFDVGGLTGSVRSARLRLYVTTGNSQTATLYLASNSYNGSTTPWTESGLTWNNANLSGSVLGSRALTPNTWIEYDVTTTVSGAGVFSFAVNNAPSLLGRIGSRESTNIPQLLVETQPD